ncbi:MAG: hypothetical protein QXI58_08325 [Candidatus Micrarchaeia archaeon]
MEGNLDALRDPQTIGLLIAVGLIGAILFLIIIDFFVYRNRFKNVESMLEYFTRKK